MCFFTFFSCVKKEKKVIQEKKSKTLLSVVKEHNDVLKIKSNFSKEIENWKELKALDNFIERFKKASPNEILSNALELESLVKSLIDSVNPPLFNSPSFNTRVNILYNESLRLSDMTFISVINAEEVHHQTDNIINSFSAINSKINSLLTKKQFEDAIEVNVDFIGLDSTKIDSVSRKSINSKKNDELLNLKKRKIKKFIN